MVCCACCTGSNWFELQRGMFRPCVSGLLAKHLDGRGAGKVYVIPNALPCSCGAGRALLCLGRHLGREESASSVVPMPSGAVVTQWQVPAVEAISRTIMVLCCLGPIKAPRWQQRNAGGHPYTSWFIIPRLVTRPVHVPWPEVYFFFCTTSGPGGKVTSSHAGSLPLRVPSRG